jgi:hypothetical protein
MFCITKIKQENKAQDRPMILLENVKEQARITPKVNGIKAV